MSGFFQYTPLELNGNTIRLLRILRNKPQDPVGIYCSLAQVSLNNHPAYHALSYAWSDESSSHLLPEEITVEGQKLTVSPNLGAALKARRERQLGDIPIWIDAICINQSDITEKSHQILRMRQIYTQAELVTVWLGPEKDDSKMAFDMIQSISQQGESSEEWIKNSLVTRDHSREWQALYHMLRRSWWRRIWIIQEMVAARNAIVFCGPHSLEPADISSCLDVLIKQQRIQRPLLLKQEGLVLEHGTFSLAGTYFHREPWKDDTLLRTLYRTGPALASDARDKIYAILNLACDSPDIVPHPDYKVSTAETYTQATIKIIENSKCLDILSLAGPTVYERVLDIQLPSWVPDFSHRVTSTINSSISSLTPVCAAGKCNATVSFIEERGILNVRGFVVDRIDGLAQVLTNSSSEATLLQSTSTSVAYNEQTIMEAISQSLIAGSLPPLQEPTAETLQDVTDLFIQQCNSTSQSNTTAFNTNTFSEWYQYNKDLRVSGKSIEQWVYEHIARQEDLSWRSTLSEFFDYRDAQHWNSRRLITTLSGNVGLGGIGCKGGDLICIIFGCSTPIILREIGSSFMLVGEAYVHGIMKGEAVKAVVSRNYVVREFELI
ncbi:hypothetical protein HYFRA_00011120 [Hymenoscyphus fraxineus]|uniref:Heterokaryon incompatibility domain-containing protein n=1 Tax=Hymenoscyphus fraxineus TaxID=746836 RepID=A0A9N9L5D2_9HELO|nr:hypothetical protein HYFRA_00011120 [Hymenoscyphus fraxineus]